jgi:hypothetical protein
MTVVFWDVKLCRLVRRLTTFREKHTASNFKVENLPLEIKEGDKVVKGTE